VTHWYDEVYLPVANLIRQQQVLQEFPGRTEADLYLWVSDHQAALEEVLGWEIGPETAAADLAEEHSSRPGRRFARIASRLLDALTPDALESGPRVGRWRMERLATRRDDSLFAHILVPVSGEDAGVGWPAVTQAAELARRENAQLLGLHIAPSAAEVESEQTRAVETEFDRLCELSGVSGSLAVEVGPVARTICERSRWADLVVANLAHPPAPQGLARLGSGFRILIRRCQAPILAVPGTYSPLRRPLLGYDGSPKAQEALFIATYLAAKDELPLVVVSVLEDGQVTQEILAQAQEYLTLRGVRATYVQESGPIAAAILNTAREHECDLLLMGGYGHGLMVEVMLGSSVDEVLRTSRIPTLIAR
jgi:nucleotide-binding universal stress UspA family protein